MTSACCISRGDCALSPPGVHYSTSNPHILCDVSMISNNVLRDEKDNRLIFYKQMWVLVQEIYIENMVENNPDLIRIM